MWNLVGRCSPCSAWLVEIWRRIRLEFTVELPLLKARWKQVLFGALFQYVHGIFTQLAHRMHQPQEQLLGDIGFKYLPELGLENAWVSETIFWCMFIPFILWTFSPFVTARKRFYTAVLYARLLMVLVTCQILRIISFTVTQLPAPNYHCRLGKDTAVREMPKHWWGHVVVDVGRQATHGCGDLIFSSHTTFVLTGVLTFTEYGETLVIKVITWIAVTIMGLCIIASRKHYSVDVVVAFYTVPLVFYTLHRRWTTKRPVQEDWPHRPLAGEEEVELAEMDLESGEESKVDVRAALWLLSLVHVEGLAGLMTRGGCRGRAAQQAPVLAAAGAVLPLRWGRLGRVDKLAWHALLCAESGPLWPLDMCYPVVFGLLPSSKQVLAGSYCLSLLHHLAARLLPSTACCCCCSLAADVQAAAAAAAAARGAAGAGLSEPQPVEQPVAGRAGQGRPQHAQPASSGGSRRCTARQRRCRLGSQRHAPATSSQHFSHGRAAARGF